jgi:hypothetical protein
MSMMRVPLGFAVFAVLLGVTGLAQPATRQAKVDAQGVLRWQDDGTELALFGVNYYTPFWHNFPDLQAVGADRRRVIDEDVAHFARLGLDALRLHVFDREVSDRDGSLVDNEHLALLDYLIAKAKDRGIYTVLTPIAWWPTPGDRPGFSARFTMPQMILDPDARQAQTNYLAQFIRHVNRHSGLTYGNDPAVVCFELINEPQYSSEITDAQVIDYVNALADAVRAAGCQKPIFYNGWGNRLGAVREARVDGATFGWYPSGLVAGRSLRRNFLPLVNQYGGSDVWNPSMRSERLGRKARMVYEFDAADVPGSHLYPAMARAFRSGGAQIATQFQYDPLPLAPFNQGWQTHYLNLVCTPQKAVSFLIAAEAFRRLPRLQDYGPYPASSRFGPFRVSYEEDLSEWVTDQDFCHSNSTSTPPPAPEKLERVVGCGTSTVVRYEGTGAYFLERLAPGTWRLEVYPDAVWVNDPYGPHSLSREVTRIYWREWPIQVRLPDLGDTFTMTPLNEGNSVRGKAAGGMCRARPGVYLLQRDGAASSDWEKAPRTTRAGLREFFALPGKPAPARVRHEPAAGWVAGKPMPLSFTVATPHEPDEATLEWGPAPSDGSRRLPAKRQRAYHYAATVPGEWLAPGPAEYRLNVRNGGVVEVFPTGTPGDAARPGWHIPVLSRTGPIPLLDADRHLVNPQFDLPWRKNLVVAMTPGRHAAQVAVERFAKPPSSLSFRIEVAEELEPWREFLDQRTTLRVRARSREAATDAIEVVVLERDGSAWGTNVPLTQEWRETRLPLTALRHFGHWGGSPAGRGGPNDRLRPREISGINVCFGAWLYPAHAAEPHTIELEAIEIE